MASLLKPAFEVTNVDSMQWNRTCAGEDCVGFASALEGKQPGMVTMTIPEDVLASIREAIDNEIDYLS
ncbi:hypothetical protein [Kribbella monticola]|uniref:hypothetical protein n=1 Tax=Kribbella monticola TaxID=2185285 RepID=UPI001300BB57|nr:hypothetical protein [Kribbella monticola]